MLALLAYPGEVVTRDELRASVWPNDSVQDFDNSLRVAINKLRQALDDDPEAPIYVETLPRRGYRWLYPVTVHENNHTAPDDELRFSKPKSRSGNRWLKRRNRAGISVANRQQLKAHLVDHAADPGRPGSGEIPSPRARDAGNREFFPLNDLSGLEYMPSFSPDGKQVAFAWTGPDSSAPYGVYIKPLADERARR